MQAEKLLCKDKEDFIAFCLKHRNKVDDSFLYDEDLENFAPDEENPTFIVKKDGNIIAAASLIVDDYHRRGRCGRFRIFYSEDKDLNIYSILLSQAIKHIKEIDKVFLFVPLTNSELSDNIKSLHFAVDRYVYLLVKEITGPQVINLPDGYSIREFQFDRDEDDWCYIRNTAFSNLRGNSTPITPEMVRKQVCSSEYLEGGLLFLMHNNNPVGIIRGVNDDYEGEPAMNIGPLAILPAYQGKGMGRQLLRAALDFAQKKKYKKVMLCVNADNERAKEIYLREGFVQIEGVIAYEYLAI
ncbi:GNAT family N-acetyltransferase [Tissierella sp. MSJ-40]|uniref:GNAT family N-acetyltransferase n=1 Tax=Tissierella simiarum TaxID=2841534 RepID=A0ABS6EB12_9FIRM|nr:GNAT family N-acetyltransferase [Tissierella simiarum]MBU5440114.1 GNAT family N-acetyltransferase [Tissierella simiarum]